MTEPLITAIVSTYRAERFMRGCLESLTDQTLGDLVEILVIDSNSPENERAIVEEFQREHANIRYVRTSMREETTGAFNRAIGLARGKYLTTANTDDRHRPDALELMTKALEEHPEFGIVYADSLITN
ncbi:MAG: glycosyltransferase family 2 protein, partial [Planctomycetes bacterium]|nr:glycosyltransferase family 2 protein [Planctomycetota bacterium]